MMKISERNSNERLVRVATYSAIKIIALTREEEKFIQFRLMVMQPCERETKSIKIK
jgi:hypothetical protein